MAIRRPEISRRLVPAVHLKPLSNGTAAESRLPPQDGTVFPHNPFVGRALLLPAIALLCACGDSIIGPNTDVGLSVWAEVSPPIISIRDTNTVLHMRVVVANKSDREIRVESGGPPYVFTFGSEPVPHSGLWGSLRIGSETNPLNAGPGIDWWGQPVYVFKPHEVQWDEQAVTLHEWKARGWIPAVGNYVARAWFNGREGKSKAFYFVP